MTPEDVRLVVAGGDEFSWSAGLYRIEIRKPVERSRRNNDFTEVA
jgi:hypothetical protein